MMRSLLTVCAILAQLAGSPAPPPDTQQGLTVRAVRLYRAENSTTNVKAFVEIPLALFQPEPSGKVTYRVSVEVTDSNGLALTKGAWNQRAQMDPKEPDAFSVEILEFALQPGRYSLKVVVQDSVSGRQTERSVDVAGYGSRPPVSDLILSPQMRVSTPADTLPRSGEWRYENMVVTGAAHLILTPLRSKAYYLVEAYPPKPDSAAVSVIVADSGGHALVHTQPHEVKIGEGGGVLRGGVDLTGLPPGEYSFSVMIKMADTTLQRSASLTVTGFEQALAKEAANAQAARVTDEGYFAAMSSEQLDTAFTPLEYIAKPGELKAYDKSMSREAKARFMTLFWASRDPSLDTPDNPVREAFYGRISAANEKYREPGKASTPGWRTDRGRIFLKYGAPDDVWRREHQGYTPALEVWKFTRGRSKYYIFGDRSNFGNWRLLHSDDLQEPGTPDWSETLGYYGLDAVGQYLGVNLVDAGAAR